MSENTRWTPGPWRVWKPEVGDGERRHLAVVPASRERGGNLSPHRSRWRIAQFFPWNRWGGKETYNEEVAANAHLIAAAPEMYEALERACGVLFRAEGNGSSLEGQNFADAIKYARAILAKARGKSQ